MTGICIVIKDKLLARAIEELFQPLTQYELVSIDKSDLVIADHPIEAPCPVLLIDTYPIELSRFFSKLELELRNVSYSFANNTYHPSSRILQTSTGKHNLTEKEGYLLTELLQAKGQTLRKDQLLQKVWNYAEGVDSHTLETHIYRLRQKIETDPSEPQILMNGCDGYYILTT